MMAAIVAYVTGVVEGGKVALRCLLGHVGYRCLVSPHP
jgi:energy-converting hydrogenase Eha subunit B